MKFRFLLLSLAALAFAACADKGDHTPDNGERETSYIAVSIKSNDIDTRADYLVGEENERAVRNATFFFFTPNGDAFDVGSGKNYIDITSIGDNGANIPNVSDIKETVLVLDNYKGNIPSKMVAVINWNYTGASISLSELSNKVESYKSGEYFTMSNSVFVSSSLELIDATPITTVNVCATKELAKANPVTIFVERLAAKVSVKTTLENKYDTGTTVGTEKVYAVVNNWDLYKETEVGYMLKHIDKTWTDDILGFPSGNTWNVPAYHRSFWATSYVKPVADEPFKWSNINYAVNNSVYCTENTYTSNSERTKVLIKATLCKEDGTPFEVARWRGTNYAGYDGLKAAVIAELANSIYSFVGGTHSSITPEDIECFAGATGTSAYEVTFRLSAIGLSKEWEIKTTGGVFEDAETNDINTRLSGLLPAMLYTNGQTYYYTDIRHFGVDGKPAKFGIVRNHVYEINITDIAGLGTPVFDKDVNIDTPETPVDSETYVASEIRIISWRLVSHDVTLQ